MSTPLRELSGTDPFVKLFNDVVREVKRNKIIETPTVKPQPGSMGTVLNLVVPTTGGASAPSAPVQLFTFFKMFGDYYLAKDSNGVTVQIAKQPELRNSVTSAWIDGTDGGINLWTYTYPNNPANSNTTTTDPLAFSRRIATLSGVPEKQAYVPRYKLANPQLSPVQLASQIYAIRVTPNTGVLSVGADTTTPVNTPITWLETTPRLWVRIANQ